MRRRCGRGRRGAGYGLARPHAARPGNRRHRLASQPAGCRYVARRGASPRRKITTPSAHPATSRERRAQQRLGTGLLKPSSTRLCEHHRRHPLLGRHPARPHRASHPGRSRDSGRRAGVPARPTRGRLRLPCRSRRPRSDPAGGRHPAEPHAARALRRRGGASSARRLALA
jgi:hypothetical protein